MKRTLITLLAAIALAACAPEANAQSFLKGLADKAKEKVKEKVENKVIGTVDGKMDEVLNGKKSKKSKDNSADASASNEKAATAQDFVRGGTVLFEDDFLKDPVGEYPAKWEVLRGSVDVFTIGKTKAANVGTGEMRPFVEPDASKYLGDEWTLEFDYYAKYGSDRENSIVVVLSTADDSETELRLNFRESDVYTTGAIDVTTRSSGNLSWNKIQMSYSKGAFKVYRNGERVVNRNRVAQYTQFRISGDKTDEASSYIDNVILCLGAKEKYEQKATDISAVEKAMQETGKFVTNNILFETGKADLKTESMIEIMKVADYMKKNPSARFEVQGHCDNQGSDKVNDPLSQKRAEAIVTALVGLGVDEFNLKAVGKGSHEPVADNKTEEGRAKNRRVEFIKK